MSADPRRDDLTRHVRGRRRRGLLLSCGAACVLLAGVGQALGMAPWPGGTAPTTVLNGTDCPTSSDVIVESPQDRAFSDPESYPPGRDWSLLVYEPESVLDTAPALGGYGAERSVKLLLPWHVRWGVEWDSEGGLLAVYGSEPQICLVARVTEHRRLRAQ